MSTAYSVVIIHKAGVFTLVSPVSVITLTCVNNVPTDVNIVVPKTYQNLHTFSRCIKILNYYCMNINRKVNINIMYDKKNDKKKCPQKSIAHSEFQFSPPFITSHVIIWQIYIYKNDSF